MLNTSEFKASLRSEQIRYLDLVFELLGEAERGQKVSGQCIVGGQILYQNKFGNVGSDCKVKETRCLAKEVNCAPYLSERGCVDANSSEGTTKECYRLVTDKNSLAKFFQDPITADTWAGIGNVILRHCQLSAQSANCQKLKTEGLRLKKTLKNIEGIPSLKEMNKDKNNGMFSPWLMRRFVALSGLLFANAHAGNNGKGRQQCSYDVGSQIFYDKDGNVTQFHFAFHSKPQSVKEFFGNTMNQSSDWAAEARKLNQANEAVNKELKTNSNTVYEKLRKGEVVWVASDISNSIFLKKGGPEQALTSMWQREHFLKDSGLSDQEVETTMCNLYGSGLYGYYKWAKEQPNPKDAMAKVKFVGVDNDRNDRVDEIEELLKQNRKDLVDAQSEVFKSAKSPGDKEFRKQFFDLISLDQSDASQAEALAKLLGSSAAANINQDMKNAAGNFNRLFETKIRLKADKQELLTAESLDRERGMARDIERNSSRGVGYVTLGLGHLQGVTENMTSKCKSQINQPPNVAQPGNMNTTGQDGAN